MKKIGAVPGHENFETLYERTGKKSHLTLSEELSLLNCIYKYIRQDLDGDGLPDWAIASPSQLFSRLVPGDDDWDNDGIPNVFDPAPLIRGRPPKKLSDEIPPHLALHRRNDHPLSLLQKKIYRDCGVLALNHTDDHSLQVLRSFDRICSTVLKKYKVAPYTFILYAFASHALFNDIEASYYAEMNFMSIGGQMIRRKQWDEEKISRTLLHEVGHYLIFRKLKPSELAQAANLHGNWLLPAETLKSFFDPLLLQPGILNRGFFPTSYSTTNAHEWLSEAVSLFFLKRMNLAKTETIPKSLEDWIAEKFQP